MIDWPWVAFGWLSIGSLAIYLQYRANLHTLQKLTDAYLDVTATCREQMAHQALLIELLKMEIDALRGRESAAKFNRVTHADFMEGAIPE